MQDMAASGIEVIELTAPAEAQAQDDVRQWAVQMFRAGRVQRATMVSVPAATATVNGAAGARTFYWWMLVGALLALSLA